RRRRHTTRDYSRPSRHNRDRTSPSRCNRGNSQRACSPYRHSQGRCRNKRIPSETPEAGHRKEERVLCEILSWLLYGFRRPSVKGRRPSPTLGLAQKHVTRMSGVPATTGTVREECVAFSYGARLRALTPP